MPQIDLAIINLTIISVFLIFSCFFILNILLKPITLNKIFFFFGTIKCLKIKITPNSILKTYVQ